MIDRSSSPLWHQTPKREKENDVISRSRPLHHRGTMPTGVPQLEEEEVGRRLARGSQNP
jgi:hypothetical protein